jgi:hypothetical protein
MFNTALVKRFGAATIPPVMFNAALVNVKRIGRPQSGP